jgi:patatin-like phospholipase/acyl hydrolase
MLMADGQRFRILSLDGGGAKGIYALGVLKGIEGMLGGRIYEHFELIYGTSTGSIIAALLALGYSVDDIAALYRKHVVKIMGELLPAQKTAALEKLSGEVFEDKTYKDFRTGVGVVCTNWETEKPYIFKNKIGRAFGDKGTFVPFFGVPIGDAVQASCSAYPFFSRKRVRTSEGHTIELADGGFCANNPTLYAIADATDALHVPRELIRVVSLGVGEYPAPKKSIVSPMRWLSIFMPVKLLQKVLEVNTQSMDQLRRLLFVDIATVRISNKYPQPEMATDLFEHDSDKLDLLWQRGRESFREQEPDLSKLLK